MSNLINTFTGKNQKSELNPIELDAYVEKIVSKYVGSYLRNRIYLASSAKIDIKDDPQYTKVVEFLAVVSNELNFMRMWSKAAMTNDIWPMIVNDEVILRFVFKGTTHVSVKSFTSEESFSRLTAHVAGALSCLSFGNNPVIEDEQLISILPRNDELLELFTGNQWTLFLYYLTRIDIISVIHNTEDNNDG